MLLLRTFTGGCRMGIVGPRMVSITDVKRKYYDTRAPRAAERPCGAIDFVRWRPGQSWGGPVRVSIAMMRRSAASATRSTSREVTVWLLAMMENAIRSPATVVR